MKTKELPAEIKHCITLLVTLIHNRKILGIEDLKIKMPCANGELQEYRLNVHAMLAEDVIEDLA